MQLGNAFKQGILWRGLYFVALLLVNVVVSRTFKADGAGWIYFFSNKMAFVLLIASLSLETGISFYASKNEIDGNKLASLAFWWSVLVSLVSVVAIYFFMHKHMNGQHKENILAFSASYIFGLLLTNYFASLFFAKQNFWLPNIVLFLVNIVLLLWLPWHPIENAGQQEHYTNIYFLLFLGQGLAVTIAYLFYYRIRIFSFPSWLDVHFVFKISLAALLANVIFFLVYRIDYWFVDHYWKEKDAYALGNYINVSKLMQMLLILPQILGSVIFPATASGNYAQMANSIQRISRLMTVSFVVLFFLTLVLGKWMFPLVFGETFNQMYWPSLFLIPGLLSLSVLHLLSAYFSGQNKIRFNIIGAIIGLVVIVVGDFIFIPKYGIIAAAAVSTAGYLSNLLYALWQFKKETQSPLMHFFIPQSSDFQMLQNSLKRK
jgi:O-antigen/teichoic acid export membrane protein